MTTVYKIQVLLKEAYKPVSKRQVFRYLKSAGVKPLNRLSRPRLYPDDAFPRVLTYLQLPKLPSMDQLRDLKRRSDRAQRRAA